jgi:hypothetical protein
MTQPLRDLLPRDKFDIQNAEAVVKAGYPAVEAVLPDLLAWMQDMNWPVARVLQPFLAEIGPPLVPHIRSIVGSSDEVWKFWIVTSIVGESVELSRLLRPELERLANSANAGEQAEGVDAAARSILARA